MTRLYGLAGGAAVAGLGCLAIGLLMAVAVFAPWTARAMAQLGILILVCAGGLLVAQTAADARLEGP